jgi:hypothetical protein
MATTKENVKKKTIELIHDMVPHLEKCLDKLLDSGAIDFNCELDNWALPKEIMCAMAKEIEHQYGHPNPYKGYKKRIQNYYAMM